MVRSVSYNRSVALNGARINTWLTGRDVASEGEIVNERVMRAKYALSGAVRFSVAVGMTDGTLQPPARRYKKIMDFRARRKYFVAQARFILAES